MGSLPLRGEDLVAFLGDLVTPRAGAASVVPMMTMMYYIIG